TAKRGKGGLALCQILQNLYGVGTIVPVFTDNPPLGKLFSFTSVYFQFTPLRNRSSAVKNEWKILVGREPPCHGISTEHVFNAKGWRNGRARVCRGHAEATRFNRHERIITGSSVGCGVSN